MSGPWRHARIRSLGLGLLLCIAIAGLSCDTSGPRGIADGPPRPSSGSSGRTEVVLLVTGGTDGILEPCNCGGQFDGGLSRRSTLIRSYRERNPRTLVVDLGDFFEHYIPTSLRNLYMLRGYEKIGYDAVALGDQEWKTPNGMLSDMLARTNAPYLSTSLHSKAVPSLPLVDHVARDWPGSPVVVLSENHDSGFRFMPQEKADELDFMPLERFAELVARWKERGRVVVVATYGDDLQLEETARAARPDLLLAGNMQVHEERVLDVLGVPAIRIGGDGYVGVVAFSVEDGRVHGLTYRVEVVDNRWARDPLLIENYVDYSKAAMELELSAPRAIGLEFVPPADCAGCHEKQHAVWKDTLHAHAFETLVKDGRTGDPNCVRCHSTGFGAQSGFYTREKTPTLANVGCQVCHAVEPSKHPGETTKSARPGRGTCLACHTQVTSPRFDFDAWVKRVCAPR